MSFQSRRISTGRPSPRPKDNPPPAGPAKPNPPADSNSTQAEQSRRMRILRRLLLTLGVTLIVLLFFAGLVKALISFKILNVESILTVAGSDLAQDEDGFTNVLLLGQGDASHDGINLTDTIMVASIDARKTKSVVLLSLPRDLYLTSTAQMGAGRINTLYRDYKGYLQFNEKMDEEQASSGALLALKQEIGTLLNIPMHYVVKVDFIGFTEAVDALGGIDIEVPETIVDTQYPGPNYSYQTFTIAAGPQHLNGETALKYARSRHTSSDFDRSARQQQILGALGEKAKEQGLVKDAGKIAQLLRIMADHVETTMSAREIISLAKLGKSVERDRVLTMQLNNQSGDFSSPGGLLYEPPREGFDGAYVLLPIASQQSGNVWGKIHTLVDLLFRNRAIHLAHPQVAVLNAGARSSLARVLGGELIRYGYDVSAIDNAPLAEKQAASWISPKYPEDEELAQYFGTLLNLPVRPLPTEIAPSPTDPNAPSPGAPAEEASEDDVLGQVTIFLGQDYEYRSLEDLLYTLRE